MDSGGDEEVEGYHLVVGGGSGSEAILGREIARDIPADEVPHRLETLLRGFLAWRHADESFHAFANRHGAEQLAEMTKKETLSALQGGEGGAHRPAMGG